VADMCYNRSVSLTIRHGRPQEFFQGGKTQFIFRGGGTKHNFFVFFVLKIGYKTENGVLFHFPGAVSPLPPLQTPMQLEVGGGGGPTEEVGLTY